MKPQGKKQVKRLWRGVRTARRGGAVVEMAVVSPLLLMILLGTIEFGYVFMIQQSITNAAREGCRLASLNSNYTDADIQARVHDSLQSTGVNVTASMVTITHATQANPTVQVSVRVPYKDVTLLGVLPSSLFRGFFNRDGGSTGSVDTKTLGSTCSMFKEVTTSS